MRPQHEQPGFLRELTVSEFAAHSGVVVSTLHFSREPPVKPFSLPQWSRIYCESRRCGSIAWAVHAQHAATKPINWNQRRQRRLQFVSGEVFEFLNYNLIFFLQRAFLARDNVKQKLKSLLARRRHSRRKVMLGNNRRSGLHRRATNSFKAGSTRFPMQRVRQSARWSNKRSHIARHEERLNTILRIIPAPNLPIC